MSDDRPSRVYTCLIDEEVRSVTIPHNGFTGPLLNLEAHLQFQEWLERIAPGARRDGRVTAIRFTDVGDARPVRRD